MKKSHYKKVKLHFESNVNFKLTLLRPHEEGGPWPGPNTSWVSSSWLTIFPQVEL